MGHPFCDCLILFSFLSNKSIHTAQNAKLTCTQIAYEKVGSETSVLIIAKKLPRGQIKDSLYLEAATLPVHKCSEFIMDFTDKFSYRNYRTEGNLHYLFRTPPVTAFVCANNSIKIKRNKHTTLYCVQI